MNDITAKFNALSLAEKLITVGAVVMLIASFLFDWITYEGFGYDGWSYPASIWSILATFTALALAAVTLLLKFGNPNSITLPTGRTWGEVYGAGGAAVVLFMLLKLWRITAAPVGSIGLGWILAAIGAGVLAYGCYLIYTAEKSRV